MSGECGPMSGSGFAFSGQWHLKEARLAAAACMGGETASHGLGTLFYGGKSDAAACRLPVGLAIVLHL